MPYYADNLGRLPGAFPLVALETRDWRQLTAVPYIALNLQANETPAQVRVAYLRRINERFARTFHEYEIFPS